MARLANQRTVKIRGQGAFITGALREYITIAAQQSTRERAV